MRILLAIFFLVMIALMFAGSADAKFIGKDNLGTCNMMTKLTIFKHKHKLASGDTVDNAMTDSSTGQIWIDAAYFAKYSATVQKFIFQHECGHAHHIGSEVGADTYAFWAMPNLTTKDIDAICATGIPDNRCENLKTLIKKKLSPNQ
jgi:hypothetical protein